MGRKTYEVGLKEGMLSPYEHLRQFVVSRTLPEAPHPAVHLHRGAPVELVRRLKAETGKGIWLCGGGKLAAGLVGEIDELILKINPVVIGSGIPLFDGAAGTWATALSAHKVYPNGFVLARYDLSSGRRRPTATPPGAAG